MLNWPAREKSVESKKNFFPYSEKFNQKFHIKDNHSKKKKRQLIAQNSNSRYRRERSEVQNEKKKIHELAKKLEKNLIL